MASNGLVHMAQQCPVMGKAMTVQARSAMMMGGGCPASARLFSASASKAKPAKSQVLGYASAVSSNDLKASVQHELHKANPAPGAGTCGGKTDSPFASVLLARFLCPLAVFRNTHI